VNFQQIFRLGVTEPISSTLNFSQFLTPIDGLDTMSSPFTHAEIDGVVAHMPGDISIGSDVFSRSQV
jgi:hypothetical protein